MSAKKLAAALSRLDTLDRVEKALLGDFGVSFLCHETPPLSRSPEKQMKRTSPPPEKRPGVRPGGTMDRTTERGMQPPLSGPPRPGPPAGTSTQGQAATPQAEPQANRASTDSRAITAPTVSGPVATPAHSPAAGARVSPGPRGEQRDVQPRTEDTRKTEGSHAMDAAVPSKGSAPGISGVAGVPGMEMAQLAARAQTPDELLQILSRPGLCELQLSCRQTVLCDGDPAAPLMIVGEAPGEVEDQKGVPFVGRSGALLTKMLAGIDLVQRSSYFISNSVFWRPPGNRTPTDFETKLCRPFLIRLIEIARPRVLLFLGNHATHNFLKITQGIRRARGSWYAFELADGTRIPARPSFHPAFLLRAPANRREAWHDLLAVRAKLEELGCPPEVPAHRHRVIDPSPDQT